MCYWKRVFAMTSAFSEELDAQSKGGYDNVHSVGERRYPKSKVRGRSGEDPTPCGGGEELPHIRCQGLQLKGVVPPPRSGAAAERV